MTESHDRTDDHFQELKELLRKAVEQATFDVQHQGVHQPSKFSDVYNRSVKPDRHLLVSSANTVLDENLRAAITQRLYPLLEEYIVDDRLGNSLAYTLGADTEITVDEFALELVKAVAILGPERTTHLLYKWAVGEPTEYQTHAVLSGIGVEEPLELQQGVRFQTLPRSRGGLLANLPSSDPQKFDHPGLIGKLKVTVDRQGGSMLCKPQTEGRSWAYGPGPGELLDSLCEALSLTCNGHVTWKAAWSECDELKTFTLGTRLGITNRLRSSYGNALLLREHLTELESLLQKRPINRIGADPLDIPVSRWLRSKRHDSLANQFIELRIALEALYLTGIQDELSFRLATRGAWHLGADFSERREYQKTLLDAYRRGSTAVHTGTIKPTEENRKLLTAAQDLCRKGILKRLDGTHEPNWNELILGKEA